MVKPAGLKTGVPISADLKLLKRLVRPLGEPVAVLLLLTGFLAGCATNPATKSVYAREPEMQASANAGNVEIPDVVPSQIIHARIEKRLEALEDLTQRQQAQIEALSASVEQLKKQNRLLKRSTQPTKMTATQSRLVKKIDRIEAQIKKTQAAPAPVKGSAKNHDDELEKNTYTAAYLALKSGRYSEAIDGFTRLLNEYPEGKYVDQSWYWLGESYLAQQKTDQAIEALQHVVNDFPGSVKHEAALMKLGIIYRNLHRYDEARAMLKRLIHDHENSTAAEQARIMLGEMDSAELKEKQDHRR